MTCEAPDLTRWVEFENLPGHVLLPEARERLNLTVDNLAGLLGVDKQTVWRWERDPERFPDSARKVPPTVRRVLWWMMHPGRPEGWPLPPPEAEAGQ